MRYACLRPRHMTYVQCPGNYARNDAIDNHIWRTNCDARTVQDVVWTNGASSVCEFLEITNAANEIRWLYTLTEQWTATAVRPLTIVFRSIIVRRQLQQIGGRDMSGTERVEARDNWGSSGGGGGRKRTARSTAPPRNVSHAQNAAPPGRAAITAGGY